jgi:2-amino-4-hydroxy-6-hydroxymethyldihydropteridine diphosphokinase
MWPRSGHWPEYRLEINDLEWAVNELGSAFASMRCPVRPVTDDGNWFST